MSAVIERALAALTQEQQSEWAEIQRGARDPLDTLSAWTPEHRRAVAVAWAEWAFLQTDACAVLREIAEWSMRLAVLLACVCARQALRYVPEGELRPLRAIKAAERWARGEGMVEECRRAAAAAAADAAYAASYAAASAWGIAHNSEILRLCRVIAEDLLTGRSSEWLL